MILSYVEFLEQEFSQNPPRQKGERTRERLKIATAKALEQKSYHAMRVADITEQAQVAEGLFYTYFKDKTEATRVVLAGLLGEFFERHSPPTGAQVPFEAISLTNRKWTSLYRANAGLIRCVFQLADQMPEFADLNQRTNRRWYERVARSVTRRRKDTGSDIALLAVYFLGSMMDEIARKLIIYPDPEFLAILDALDADDAAVADAASVIWLRILYPNESHPMDLAPAALALAGWIGDGRGVGSPT